MLCNLKEILTLANAKNIAIGAFNTPNFESLRAVLGAAEELALPVILMHAQIHEAFMPLRDIGPVMTAMAEKAAVPVCVHLDHGEDLGYLKKALDLGFTSIMYDGSALSYEENAENTRKAVEMAKSYGAGTEGEIGTLGAREMGKGHEEETAVPTEVYTDPVTAERFVKETGIDALACSFGTAHGLYLKEPKLDFTVLEKIRGRTEIPLVMHGGSGVSPEDYKAAIRKGVRKINYFTYMSKAGGEEAVRQIQAAGDSVVYFHELEGRVTEAMKANVRTAMGIFAGLT